MPKKYFLFVFFVFSFFLLFFSSEDAWACTATKTCAGQTISEDANCDCTCQYPSAGTWQCQDPGCHIDCDKAPGSGQDLPSGSAVCNNCAGGGGSGGGGNVCSVNGSCDSSSCGWNGNANCNNFGLRDSCGPPGCNWRQLGDGYNEGVCDGKYCQIDNTPGWGCYSFSNDKTNCQSQGCNWTQGAGNVCGGSCSLNGASCGQLKCPDVCTGALVSADCPIQACPSPTPTPTPTSSPTPTPTPTPSPTPTPVPPGQVPAWFQARGGDVHANGRIGTTIPATCGVVCSIGNFLSKILNELI